MATTAYGSYVSNTVSGSTRKWRAFITYTVASTDTTTTLTMSKMGMDLSGGSSTTMKCTAGNTNYTLSATGQTSISKTSGYPSSDKTVNGSDDWTMLSSKTFSWSKTTSAATKTVNWKVKQTSSSSWSGTSTASFTVTVPALASYSITYNLNGGSGTAASQTKYYGTNITLNNGSAVTRDTYTLTGWNTNASGTGTHYNLGATYTGNAGLTLYAEWKRNTVSFRRKISGAWKTCTVYRKINGSWVAPHTGYVKVNGTWKKIT